MARTKLKDTTVPPITGTFEDAVSALLATPAPSKNLARAMSQIAKKKTTAQKANKKR